MRPPRAKPRHQLSFELAKLRKTTGWDVEEFAYQVGMSESGYHCIESGSRVPKRENLQKILDKVKPLPATEAKLIDLWNDARAEQVGIPSPSRQTPKVDSASLSRRISTEAAFVLKQAGVVISTNTKSVIEKRVLMILNSVLGV
jgi:transcriptional regulator with XRE-family HTH domain